ncbi:MAG: NADH-quinone oxidoreductase subunit M [Deltaproteobacteria bacterium]|nr:NADH-quinone oxidoreductase subunit M [Deltaproteobacteria bacterium]
MITLPWLSMTVAAPFIATLLLLPLKDTHKLAMRLVSLLGATVSVVGSLAVYHFYDAAQGGLQLAENYPLVPKLGITLRLAVDGWGVSLLLLTGIIIFTGVLATWTLKEREKEFFALLLTLVAGVLGVFVAQDLFVFFLFYEIAVLPMYVLIAVWGSSNKVAEAGPFKFVWKMFDIGGKEYAAMKLTIMLLVGSAFILVAILAMFFAAGGETFDMSVLGNMKYDMDLQKWLFPLVWLGFGTLAGVFPFHTWSPDGHASAPTAVSMLHAGVLMKLGAFGVIRIGMMMLPEGAQFWIPLVGVVAAVNVVYGALSAMAQKDLKYIIAYSSVSHMGVVMLGAATLTQGGWNGAVYQMFAHGIMTGLFFALVGLVYERAHTRWVPSMGGFAGPMPIVALFFTIGGLSSLGLPGTAGFVAEFMVFLGAWQSKAAWWAIPGIIGAFITAIYVLRVVRDVFWGPGPSAEFHDMPDARRTELGALVILGACILVFGIWPRLILDFIDPCTRTYLGRIVPNAEAMPLPLPPSLTRQNARQMQRPNAAPQGNPALQGALPGGPGVGPGGMGPNAMGPGPMPGMPGGMPGGMPPGMPGAMPGPGLPPMGPGYPQGAPPRPGMPMAAMPIGPQPGMPPSLPPGSAPGMGAPPSPGMPGAGVPSPGMPPPPPPPLPPPPSPDRAPAPAAAPAPTGGVR